MDYQDIQDCADELASAKMGYGSVDEAWYTIKNVYHADYGEMMAIQILCNALIASEQGADVDWDSVTEEAQSLL